MLGKSLIEAFFIYTKTMLGRLLDRHLYREAVSVIELECLLTGDLGDLSSGLFKGDLEAIYQFFEFPKTAGQGLAEVTAFQFFLPSLSWAGSISVDQWVSLQVCGVLPTSLLCRVLNG